MSGEIMITADMCRHGYGSTMLCPDCVLIGKLDFQLAQQKALLDEAVKVINMLPISADTYTEKTRGAFLEKVKNEQ